MDETERLRGVVKDCVHCGFCLPACPTYQLWAEEMDSPRGRIYLVNQILEGAEMTPAAAEHFDRCLGCMACMTAPPPPPPGECLFCRISRVQQCDGKLYAGCRLLKDIH